ncbi:MAG TPA: CpsD/CapB family tyrosine-protein kinase [Pirellulales bacterium]|jgi:Mrp family chromosome partitioning ATPase|nr:CpsD/CapB family tyrosine-protein kinase [Pirellulales bacterium]
MITSSRAEAVAQPVRPRVVLHPEAQAHFQALLSRLPWRLDSDSHMEGDAAADGQAAGGARRDLCTLGLTSCYSGEGVSTVAMQLALTAAERGDCRVLLVDANQARPAVHRMFGIPATPGWSDVVRGETAWEAAVRPAETPGLFVLAAGAAARGADDSAGWSRAIRELRTDFDLIVFDLPPSGDASGGDRLAARMDGVLLVVEAERVRWQVAQRTKERLVRGDARLVGAVLNKRQRHVPGWLYQTL